MDPVSVIPGLARLWHDTGGDPAIRIAIIDGPADFAHPSRSGAGLSIGGSTAGAIAAVGSEHGTPVASVLMGQAERSLGERATPSCPRYRGPDKRFYLAPGVRVQRPRHAQRLAGSARARPPILPRGLLGHQRHDQAPRLGKEVQ